MNTFEIFLLVLLCISVFIGPAIGHSIGYSKNARRSFDRGYRWGHRDGVAEAGALHDELPRKITKPMPVVPIAVVDNDPRF